MQCRNARYKKEPTSTHQTHTTFNIQNPFPKQTNPTRYKIPKKTIYNSQTTLKPNNTNPNWCNNKNPLNSKPKQIIFTITSITQKHNPTTHPSKKKKKNERKNYMANNIIRKEVADKDNHIRHTSKIFHAIQYQSKPMQQQEPINPQTKTNQYPNSHHPKENHPKTNPTPPQNNRITCLTTSLKKDSYDRDNQVPGYKKKKKKKRQKGGSRSVLPCSSLKLLQRQRLFCFERKREKGETEGWEAKRERAWRCPRRAVMGYGFCH